MSRKKITLLYRLQRKLFTFLGDIKVFGWAHPMWFGINAHGYKLKGAIYRKLRDLLEPGDIILRRFDGYLSSYMIPGFWNHAGLYVGDIDGKPEQVVHAVSEGVLQEDFLNFIRTDHLIILRPPAGKKGLVRNTAIKEALKVVGSPYDFGFDFENANRFSCTELVDYCYPELVKGKKRFGRRTVVADDFANCQKLKVVWNSVKDDEVTSMGVVQAFFKNGTPGKTKPE